MEVVFTKEEAWLEKWDSYVVNAPRGSHLILSDWLKSYASYGFDFEVGIALKDDKIIGGLGVIIPKVLFFKFYIVPHGPILDKAYENYINDLLIQARSRAKKIKCSYFQFSLPISNNPKISKHTFSSQDISLDKALYKKGKLFSHVYSSYGLNWVDFNKTDNAESLLQGLTTKVRRNIRLPYNKGAVANFEQNEDSIRQGYGIIEANARSGNYALRSYDDFKNTILNLVKKGYGSFINIYVNEDIKASCFVIKAGNYMTNISGGTLREKPDIKLGYMLQWEAIKKSFDLDYGGYNISMGGSEGVKEFKEKFSAEAIYFEEPHYHSVLRPFVFKSFLVFEKIIKPYKSYISKVLSKYKKGA